MNKLPKISELIMRKSWVAGNRFRICPSYIAIFLGQKQTRYCRKFRRFQMNRTYLFYYFKFAYKRSRFCVHWMLYWVSHLTLLKKCWNTGLLSKHLCFGIICNFMYDESKLFSFFHNIIQVYLASIQKITTPPIIYSFIYFQI